MGDGSSFKIKTEKSKNFLEVGRAADLILDQIEDVRRNAAVDCDLMAGGLSAWRNRFIRRDYDFTYNDR